MKELRINWSFPDINWKKVVCRKKVGKNSKRGNGGNGENRAEPWAGGYRPDKMFIPWSLVYKSEWLYL